MISGELSSRRINLTRAFDAYKFNKESAGKINRFRGLLTG